MNNTQTLSDFDAQTQDWIKDILSNDENSSDEELVEYFMEEGPMSKQQAEDVVTKRKFYLNNIVLDDGSIYKPHL